MPIHVAITRRVRPGREAEFQQGLHDFLEASFEKEGVLGAQMITPPRGSNSREYGILRTFTDEEERDEFYASPLFKAWRERAADLTEGEPEYRDLHGLEAWFRAPGGPPPKWKMALVTLLGVYPISLTIGLVLAPRLKELPLPLNSLIVSALIVICLTWLVMPLLTRWFKAWLHPEPEKKETPS